MDIEDAFRQHQRAVFSYLLRTTGDRDLAEELTQETFFRACTAILRFRGDASVCTWLLGVARRVLLEASRKGAFRKDVSFEDAAVPLETPDIDQRLDLEAAFANMGFDDRECLLLVDLLGFSPTEAAVLVGIEPGALRMRLHRARRRLRSQMGGTT